MSQNISLSFNCKAIMTCDFSTVLIVYSYLLKLLENTLGCVVDILDMEDNHRDHFAFLKF